MPKPKLSNPAKEEPDDAPATPQDLHELVHRAARSIVNANIAQATKGSYLHAKFLFEFAGLQAVLPEPTDAEEESLAQMLLRELENGGPDQAPS